MHATRNNPELRLAVDSIWNKLAMAVSPKGDASVAWRKARTSVYKHANYVLSTKDTTSVLSPSPKRAQTSIASPPSPFFWEVHNSRVLIIHYHPIFGY